MKDKYFNDALSCIDSDIVDEFIRENEKIEKKKRVRGAFLRYGTVAACFCIIVSIAAIFANLYPLNPPPVIPSDNTSSQDVTSGPIQGDISDVTTNGNGGGITLPPNFNDDWKGPGNVGGAPSKPTDIEYLQLIYQTGDDYYGPDGEFNYSNVIDTTTVRSTVDTVPQTRIFIINGLEKELRYESTLYYPLRDHTRHEYVGDNGEKILVDESGAISDILYDFCTLNIRKQASPTEALTKLKGVIDDYVDIDKYTDVKMPEYKLNSSGGFGSYGFLFYKTVDGCMTDWMRVTVDDNGRVYGLRISNKYCNLTELNINKETESYLLELKFRNIFTTKNTEYLYYELTDLYPNEVVIRGGEPYICYAGSARFAYKDGGEVNSFLINVLIPIDLICD